jgi:predicted Zn finger-like uncharacterized protein
MQIVCPSCETSYRVRPNSLPPYGQARCLRCLAIWSPQRHRADKLLAAAAAIGEDFPPLPDPAPGEASTSLDPGCVIVPEIAAADPDQSLAVAEGTAANPEMTSSLSPEIYFVDLEPDHLPLAAEDVAAVDLEPDHLPVVAEGPAAVDLEPDRLLLVAGDTAAADLESALFVGEAPAAGHEPQTDVVADGVAQDAPLGGPAGPSDHLPAPDAEAVLTLWAPPEEHSHASVTEALALDSASEEEGGASPDDRWLPAYLPAEITHDETSAGPASEKETLATLAEIAGSLMLRSGTQDECDGLKDSQHEAPLSAQPRPEAKKCWIVLKTGHSRKSSENAKQVEHRTASRSGRNLPVLSRALNVPPRRLLPRWPLSNLHTGILALALVDFLLVGWRADIVRKLPQTASFYELAGLPVNLRGLAFHGITTSTVRHDGTPVLVVEGNIVNDTHKALRVPQLRFALRDAAAQEVYSWTASADRTSLPPGQAMTFRARLASPPAGARDVVLRFVNRRDVVASIR